MSKTVGTVDIAVKLNTAEFTQQVQQAVNYTTKAFNSIDISKAFQNQFKQATNVVQQASKSMASATQNAVSSVMGNMSNTISDNLKKSIKETEKEIP